MFKQTLNSRPSLHSVVIIILKKSYVEVPRKAAPLGLFDFLSHIFTPTIIEGLVHLARTVKGTVEFLEDRVRHRNGVRVRFLNPNPEKKYKEKRIDWILWQFVMSNEGNSYARKLRLQFFLAKFSYKVEGFFLLQSRFFAVEPIIYLAIRTTVPVSEASL